MSPGNGQMNPVCSCPGYRRDVLSSVPSLEMLDGIMPTTAEKSAVSRRGADSVEDPTKVRHNTDNGFGEATKSTVEMTRGPARSTGDMCRTQIVGGAPPTVLGQNLHDDGSAVTMARDDYIRPRAPNFSGAASSWSEDVSMPRFEAVAVRFRQRRGQHGRRNSQEMFPLANGCDDDEYTRQDSNVNKNRYWPMSGSSTSSTGEAIVEYSCKGRVDAVADHMGARRPVLECDRRMRGRDMPAVGSTGMMVPIGSSEEGGLDHSVSPGGDEDVFRNEGGLGRADNGSDEQGLLSRLRSVAYEARLEVMDSRLQDLHVSNANFFDCVIWNVIGRWQHTMGS